MNFAPGDDFEFTISTMDVVSYLSKLLRPWPVRLENRPETHSPTKAASKLLTPLKIPMVVFCSDEWNAPRDLEKFTISTMDGYPPEV